MTAPSFCQRQNAEAGVSGSGMRNPAGVDRLTIGVIRKELVPGTRHEHNKFCLIASLLPFMQKQSFPTIAGRRLIGICRAYIILPTFRLSIRSLMYGGECLTVMAAHSIFGNSKVGDWQMTGFPDLLRKITFHTCTLQIHCPFFWDLGL